MARINLLPWRQEERARKNKEFNVLAGAAAALSILAVLIALTFLNRDLSNQQAANDKITQENTRLEGVIKEIEGLEQQKADMVARMKVIQDLQGRRSVPVRVWDDIVRAVPSSMYLVGMKRESNTITFTGFAANPNVVSEFIRNLDASPWLAHSSAPNIKTSVEAYAAAPALNKDANQMPRTVLPEDSYINFTVATRVVTDVTTDAEGQPIPEGQPALEAGQAPADANAQPAQQPAQQAPEQPAQQPAQPATQNAPAQPAQASAPADANAQPAQQAPAQPTAETAPAQPAQAPAQEGQANTQPAGGK